MQISFQTYLALINTRLPLISKNKFSRSIMLPIGKKYFYRNSFQNGERDKKKFILKIRNIKLLILSHLNFSYLHSCYPNFSLISAIKWLFKMLQVSIHLSKSTGPWSAMYIVINYGSSMLKLLITFSWSIIFLLTINWNSKQFSISDVSKMFG